MCAVAAHLGSVTSMSTVGIHRPSSVAGFAYAYDLDLIAVVAGAEAAIVAVAVDYGVGGVVVVSGTSSGNFLAMPFLGVNSLFSASIDVVSTAIIVLDVIPNGPPINTYGWHIIERVGGLIEWILKRIRNYIIIDLEHNCTCYNSASLRRGLCVSSQSHFHSARLQSAIHPRRRT